MIKKQLAKIISISSIMLGLIAFTIVGSQAAADTYDVNALVPYAVPSSAAVIQLPSSGSSVQNAIQQVSGSCENIAPAAVISIWRGGQIIGSTSCASGAFQLNVMLQLGLNNLIARTANGNGVYGPDSTTVSVTYIEPIVVTPLTPNIIVPTNPSEQQSAANSAAKTGLAITTQEPFSVITTDNDTVTIRIKIEGGTSPYTMQLNWGDGSVETKAIETAGTYEFTHVYHTQRGYTVYVRVRDVRGAYTEYVYAIISTKTGDAAQTASGGQSDKAGQDTGLEISYYFFGVLLLLLILLAISTYVLGYRRARKRFELDARGNRRMSDLGNRIRKDDKE